NVFSEFLEDLPDTNEPVWILGECYNVKTEKSELLSDVHSKLWFTYRKKFSPIGGTGPSSDTGWGCMLRCGQMILAQALVCQHLGREWRWVAEGPQPTEYQRILHCFLDRKDSCYSIHQMAQMGVGEGKSVGEWYGPNTVAQVLKKLALFDDWNSLAVYVSMDNTVVIEDISKFFYLSCCCCCFCTDYKMYVQSLSSARSLAHSDREAVLPGGMAQFSLLYVKFNHHMECISSDSDYFLFKECFKMPQSCGVLGGKPNLAYYFIGFIDDELIYLDPHTTQLAVDSETGTPVHDQSYHCQRSPHRMKITSLEPSVALGFFCRSEEDFDGWCSQVQQELVRKRNLRLFELVEKHPPHWPPFVPPTKPDVQTTGAEFIESTDKLFESEEEFEILNV
uniref:Cysteine protease n=1 Tax=Electrophorus electricus TaxID=8005 RepID=A0AAY5E9I9_ELEEL